MIDFTLFEFASLPRTGNGWFLRACKLAGLGKFATDQAIVPFNGSCCRDFTKNFLE